MTQKNKDRVKAKVAALTALFPQCFASPQHGTPYRPLKLDIHLDLAARGFKVPSAVMSSYCHRVPYLKALVAGGPRYDLDGNPVLPEVSQNAKDRAAQKIIEIKARALKAQRQADAPKAGARGGNAHAR